MSSLTGLSIIALKYPDRWGAITNEISRIDLALATTKEEVSDKCKTLCETVLKTVLVITKTKTEEECESLGMEALKPLVCNLLKLAEADKKLFNAEITYLQNTRNNDGTGGHGRSLQRQAEIRSSINENELDHLISLTDSLVTTIVHRFEEKFPSAEAGNRLKNDANYENFIDSQHEATVINGVHYAASEILYSTDPTAYATGLAEFKLEFKELYND